MKIIKDKDNFNPTKQIFKVNYIYRESGYIINHLDAWKSEIVSSLRGMKVIVNSNLEIYNQHSSAL